MKKNIYIVGIGGRTGSMFARELQGTSDIVGLGLDREIDAINNGKLKIQRGGAVSESLKATVFRSADFGAAIENGYPDYILLAVRNPIAEAVKFYYRQLQGKEKFPSLIISQNGLSVINDAKSALKEVLGSAAERVVLIRVSLINGIDAKMEDGTFTVSYKLPIKLGLGAAAGSGQLFSAAEDLAEIFRSAGFKTQEFKNGDVFKMENSKLFTNLIGMAAAVHNFGEPKAAAVNGVTVSDGFRDKKIFEQEVIMLKEYAAAVKASGGGFVDDLAGYPIKFLARIMMLPAVLLVPFRGVFGRVVAKGRNRPKDLSEIDYYNGEVVKLGKKFNVPIPVNEMIVAKAKEILCKNNK